MPRQGVVAIHTVTPNAALDQRFNEEGELVYQHVGGKGIICARGLRVLEYPDTIHGYTWLGGETGAHILAGLPEGVSWNVVGIESENRRTLIKEGGGGTPAGFSVLSTDRGVKASTEYPTVSRGEIAALDAMLEQNVRHGDMIVWGGSLPHGCEDTYFAERIRRFPYARHIVDTSNAAALKQAVQAGVSMIMPNQEELIKAFCTTIYGLPRLFAQYSSLDTVLLSRSEEGLVLARRGQGLIVARPPAVEVVCTLGAGDYAGAGFLASIAQGMDDADALRYATAFATDSVRRQGSSCGTRKTLLDVLASTRVEMYGREEQPHHEEHEPVLLPARRSLRSGTA